VNPWKLTTIGMALVVATTLATGLVVANWSGGQSDRKAVDVAPGRAAPRVAASSAAPTAAGMPTESAINSCNQSAAAQAGQRENTKDIRRIMAPLVAAMDHPRTLNQMKVEVMDDPHINAASAGGAAF
jgi:hypothetical protein